MKKKQQQQKAKMKKSLKCLPNFGNIKVPKKKPKKLKNKFLSKFKSFFAKSKKKKIFKILNINLKSDKTGSILCALGFESFHLYKHSPKRL